MEERFAWAAIDEHPSRSIREEHGNPTDPPRPKAQLSQDADEERPGHTVKSPCHIQLEQQG
jgi:hypothetical protein